MPYIGTQVAAGNYRKLVDISTGFNGSTTSFTLAVPPGGAAEYYVTPASVNQLLISVGGVIQQPGVDFTVSTYTITFTTAPISGLSFFGVLMGDALSMGTPSDGTVTAAKLNPTGGSAGQTFVINSSGQFSFGTAGGATGGVISGASLNAVFYENDQTVTVSYAITAGKNAVTAGPIAIESGVTVTVPSGSSWTIV
jgi:hypothetical protein